jgi:hypothetical protein
MFEFPRVFVGKRFSHKGKFGKAIAETDSGNVKLVTANGEEINTSFHYIHPIDGYTEGFVVFELPSLPALLAA